MLTAKGVLDVVYASFLSQRSVTLEEVLVANDAGDASLADLRALLLDVDPVPHVFARKQGIVVCLPPVRAIVLVDRLLLLIKEPIQEIDSFVVELTTLSHKFSCLHQFFDALNSGSDDRSWEYDLLRLIRGCQFSITGFEACCLEILLEKGFQDILFELEQLEAEFVEELTLYRNRSLFDTEKSQRLQIYENCVKRFEARLAYMRQAFDEILWSHCKLRNYNLLEAAFRRLLVQDPRPQISDELREAIAALVSSIVSDPNRTGTRLDEFLTFFDSLLDGFSKRVREMLNNLDRIVTTTVRSRAKGREALALIDLIAGLVLLTAGMSSYVSGIFGMNVGEPVYDMDTVGAAKFWSVFSLLLIAGFGCTAILIRDVLIEGNV
ncbi:MAG: hypothetical protein KVP17_000784 [Porospora cf. gigantea B]|uniref:uncharacterized protein n=1 Tax=Porospora cf. gigantea B TaxID=2853592 RepID=UPI00357193C4|nr:MAG: hypothetical protein KVP17_000784 [Porospora cf. gigantea B]